MLGQVIRTQHPINTISIRVAHGLEIGNEHRKRCYDQVSQLQTLHFPIEDITSWAPAPLR